MRGRVHVWGFVGFVGWVLFPWVLWSMLSGPRHLLSALALGMYVGPVVVDPPVLLLCFSFVCVCVGGFLVSFVLPLGFGFVVSLGLFRPVGSAGVGGASLVD